MNDNRNKTSMNIQDLEKPLKSRVFESPHATISLIAQRHPSAVALADDRHTVNYRDLTRLSNNIAHALMEHGIKRGDKVAVYGGRCAQLVASILGILKTGAAFILLDPSYPATRSMKYIDITKPQGILQIKAHDTLPQMIGDYAHGSGCACMLEITGFETINSRRFDSFSGDDPRIVYAMDQIAYVIFTSGTTGTPKAVCTNLTPLSHFIAWHSETFGFSTRDKFSMLSGLTHDPILCDIFTPLCVGATLCIPGKETINDPHRLVPWMIDNKITVSHLTPAMGKLLTDIGPSLQDGRNEYDTIDSLRFAFFGGDMLTKSDVGAFKRIAPNVTCVNFYGTTETPQAMAHYVVPRDALDGEANDDLKSIPVGSGIEGVHLLVLSPDYTLCPIGEIGEIYIRTPYLSLGYLNDQSMTDDRYMVNPWTKDPRDRLYKTGDNGRYCKDGNVEYLGRRDNQIKIRGFRIELNEIQIVLKNYQYIKEAVVLGLDFPGGEKRIVAYYSLHGASESIQKTKVADIRRYLLDTLPQYMVPQHFVKMDSFPLTPNGKIDKASLPRPRSDRVPAVGETEQPGNETEKILAGIWREVMNLDGVGRNSDFFELGGQSLMVFKIVDRINAHFKCYIAPAQLFDNPTIAAMARLLGSDTQTANGGGPNTGTPFLYESNGTRETSVTVDFKKCLSVLSDAFAARTAGKNAKPNKIYGMKQSFLCKYILSKIYKIDRGSIRSLLDRVILKLEGGAWFTVTLRKLYERYYNMHIGDYSSFCFHAGNFKPGTTFGRYCDITRTARFETANHPVNTISSHGIFYQQSLGFSNGFNIPRNKIRIGNDVHIGHNVSLLYPLKEVGDGAVIGSGAIVTFDVPPYAIVGGYPATIIRYRFPKDIIETLQRLKWWDATLEELEPLKDEFIKPVKGRSVR